MDRDSQLVDSIKQALEDELKADSMDINVEVKNGNVHLSGIVDDLRDKLQAQDIVKQFNNIHRIENNITVAMDGSISDKELKERIELELRRGHNSMHLKDVGVKVSGGAATLVGQARTLADEITALEIVRSIKGVKHAASTIKIGNRDFNFDDISLVNRVQQALSNSAIQDTDVEVTVSHGIAKLTGVVETQYQVELAGEIAAHVEGIQKVRNELNKVGH